MGKRGIFKTDFIDSVLVYDDLWLMSVFVTLVNELTA